MNDTNSFFFIKVRFLFACVVNFLKSWFRIYFHIFGYAIHKTKTVEKFHRDYKLLVARYCEKENFTLREETNDHIIFKEVFIDNSYELPASIKGETVLDLGAHIGSFSLLSLTRGAKQIVAVEPDPKNFEVLTRNLSPYASTVLINKAVWKNNRDDVSVCGLSSLPSHIKTVENCQPSKVCKKTTPVTIEEIFSQTDIETIDFLKTDIEGAEIEVFSTLPREFFKRINKITGEWHGLKTPQILKQHLSAFYDIIFRPTETNVGYFFASKK